MNFQKQTLRPLFFLFLLTCLLSGLVGVVRVPVEAAPLNASAQDVIINEIAWGGTIGAITDEWIELHNPTAANIDLTGWTLSATSGTPSIINISGIIPANGYFLLERTDDTATSIVADQIFVGAIANGGDSITLRDQLSNIIDTANSNGNVWPGGSAGPNFFSMERISIGVDADSNWGLNNGIIRSGTDVGGNPINGTPKQQNSIYALPTSTPTNTNIPTDTSTPTLTFTPSNTPIFSLTPSLTPIPGEVVISEVAWSGTEASSNDEWIELYNTRATPITLTGWRLVNFSGSVDIVINGVIPANGFFLLERARDLTVSDVIANQIYSGALGDTNDSLTLSMPNGRVIDTANNDLGAWPAGTGSPNLNSMERVVTGGVPAPDTASGWVSNAQASTWTKHDAAGNLIHGTPAGSNWGFTVTATSLPTITPTFTATTTPTRTLTPTITSTALTAASSIVISEFRTIGPSGGNDEFIELYNPTASVVSIGGWIIKRSSICGTTVATMVNIPATVTLAAGQHYLIGGTTYSGTVIPDLANISLGIGDTGGLALFRADGVTIVDQVGLCASTLYREGTALTAVVANANQSWDRKSSLTGLCVDSNNNFQDFILRRPSDPQNFASTLTRCGNPTATPTITQPPTTGPKPTRTRTPQPTALPPPPPLIAINEFVPRPGHDWNNDGVINTGDEYIELINHGVIAVNLSGYSLDDEANIGSSPFQLPAEILKPGERMVFYSKVTGLLLSDGGDGVRLLKPNGQLGDAYNYTVVRNPDQSYCRLPDDGGLDIWNQNCFPTPGLKNSLNGNFSKPPTGAEYDLPLCPISDTLPIDFAWAECPSFGNIWSRFYWDATGWLGEMTIPDINSKWDVYVD